MSHQAAIGVNFQAKTIFVTVCVIVASILIDTSVVKTSVYTGGLHGSTADIVLFTVISLIYAMAQYLIVRVTIERERFRTRTMILIHKSVIILQYVLIIILIITIVQMILTSSYSSIILKIVTWINYSMSIVFLGLLAKKFFSWYSTRRNLILITYAIAMLFLCMDSIMSIIDISYGLTIGASALISITKSGVAMISAPSLLSSTVNSAYFIISLLAFTSIWFATVLLLKHYSNKIGKAKYWILVSIPLAYFLTQFQTILLYLFTPIRVTDPIIFGITYTLIFSASKPIGGILFGISFWIVSRGLNNPQVKKYMIISGYGLLLLFTASQHQVLLQYPYPPFGLPTICYVGLASYLVLVGVYSAALSVARDSELRKEFYKTARSQLDLLKTIGVTEMEKQLIKTYKSVDKRTRSLDNNRFEKDDMRDALHGLVDEMDKEQVTEILHDVLTELYAKPRPKGKF